MTNRAPRVQVQKPKPRKKTKQEIAKTRVPGKVIPSAYPAAKKQEWVEPNRWDLAELYSSRAKYTANQKLDAVTAYVMTGTVIGASRLTGLSQKLISNWKQTANWWPDAYKAVKLQKQEEMDGAMTTIIHLSADKVVDSLLNGDEVVTKDGDIVRRQMSGKEAAWVMSITHDKRALLRGDPTSRTEKVDTNRLLEQLKESFENMAKPKVVSDQ